MMLWGIGSVGSLLCMMVFCRKKPELMALLMHLWFSLNMLSMYLCFPGSFQSAGEKMISLTGAPFAALFTIFLLVGFIGYFSDRFRPVSRVNVFILLPISMILVKFGFHLYKMKLGIWFFEAPSTLVSVLFLFVWLFLFVGFFEILSAVDLLFASAVILYSLSLQIVFHYAGLPLVWLNMLVLCAGCLLFAVKLFSPKFTMGRTIAFPLSILMAIIPVVTRVKSFTFITFLFPVFLISLVVILFFLNFFYRSLILRTLDR